jgi:excisionase family DNA binding protein
MKPSYEPFPSLRRQRNSPKETKSEGSGANMGAKKPRQKLIYEQLSFNSFRVEKGYYTTREVAELYHVSVSTVVNWIQKGWIDASRLEGKKKPGNWHIHPHCLEDLDREMETLVRSHRGLFVRAYGHQKKQRGL